MTMVFRWILASTFALHSCAAADHVRAGSPEVAIGVAALSRLGPAGSAVLVIPSRARTLGRSVVMEDLGRLPLTPEERAELSGTAARALEESDLRRISQVANALTVDELALRSMLANDNSSYSRQFGRRPRVTVGPCIPGASIAIIYWSESRGPLDGSGGLMIFERQGEAWVFRSRQDLHVS